MGFIKITRNAHLESTSKLYVIYGRSFEMIVTYQFVVTMLLGNKYYSIGKSLFLSPPMVPPLLMKNRWFCCCFDLWYSGADNQIQQWSATRHATFD